MPIPSVMSMVKRRRSIAFALGLLAVALCWSIVTFVVGPRLISAAYHQQSLPVLNQLISGQNTRQVEFYEHLWYEYATWALVMFLGISGFAALTMRKDFWRSRVGTSTPEYLALLRILACGLALLTVLWEDLPSFALLPDSMRVPMGFLEILYALPIGFEAFVRDSEALRVFEVATAAILVMGLCGFRTRLSVPLGAVCYLLFGGLIRQYSHLHHYGLIPLYVLIVLSFCPCADRWSLDAWFNRGGKTSTRSPALYGLSRYVCWIVIALPYTFSGLSKLRNGGWFWWEGANIKTYLLSTSLSPMQFDWKLSLLLKDYPDWLFSILGLITLFGELLFILVLFFHWARFIFPIIMIGMHMGVWFLQNILFYDLLILVWVFPVGELMERRNWNQRDKLARVPPLRDRVLLTGSLAAIACCWIPMVEYYPITMWQMFSHNNERKVQYYKVIASYKSGRRERFYPERVIGAVKDARYRDSLPRCFEPERDVVCREFYSKCANLYNRRQGASDAIAAIEVEEWRWDIEQPAADSNFGTLARRVLIAVK